METKELVNQSSEKNYAGFDKTANDILSQKVAQKLADTGYFDRLDVAKATPAPAVSEEEVTED